MVSPTKLINQDSLSTQESTSIISKLQSQTRTTKELKVQTYLHKESMLLLRTWISEYMSQINLQFNINTPFQGRKDLKSFILPYQMMKVRSVLLLVRCLSRINKLLPRLLFSADKSVVMDTKLKRLETLNLKMHANALFFLEKILQKCFSSQRTLFFSGITWMKERIEEQSITSPTLLLIIQSLVFSTRIKPNSLSHQLKIFYMLTSQPKRKLILTSEKTFQAFKISSVMILTSTSSQTRKIIS